MQLTDDERQRWKAAETAADRKAIIRESWRRICAERAEDRIGDAIVDSLNRFFKVDLR